jgi:MoxR-like ATPase
MSPVRPVGHDNVPVRDRLAAVLGQLERIVVGKPGPLRLALACLLARGHLLIEDIPGVGKSTLAQALAATLGLPYARIQFTSDLLPADVLGLSIFDQQAQAFRFHPGPIFHSVVLADEINRAPPKTQSALLEAMEERQVSQDGNTRELPEPFFVIATQNPVEQVGAYPLPESQLDRFLMAIDLGYPDAAAERELLTGGDRRAQIPRLAPLADPATLVGWQREAAAAHVAPALLDYVQALLAATRGNTGTSADPGLRRGLSPRAGLLLMAAARAWALLAGRPMVLPEDVQAVFPAVAGHRLAGGARAGALQAQALLRTVAVA